MKANEISYKLSFAAIGHKYSFEKKDFHHLATMKKTMQATGDYNRQTAAFPYKNNTEVLLFK